MIRRWQRQAVRNATDASPERAAEAGEDTAGRMGRRGRGRGRERAGRGLKLSLLKDVKGGADFAARRGKGGGRGGRGMDNRYRGYAPGPQTAGLGKWGSRLTEHNCYEGFLAKPPRQPYVC